VSKVKPKRFLRAHWKQKGLKRSEVAHRLGVHEATVRSHENGNREVSAEMAVRYEEEFGIPREVVRPDIFRRKAVA